MIDINAMERRMTRRDNEPLLPPSPEEVFEMVAEIRRLRGGGHWKCPCGGDPVENISVGGKHWIDCDLCQCRTDYCDTRNAAWAAWDGVE